MSGSAQGRAARNATIQITALVALYVAIALLPLVLAALQGLSRRPWHMELSSGLAMAAFAMLLVEFMLAGRGRRLSGILGMDITMQAHRFAGIAALALLALHPMLYGGSIHTEPQVWDPMRNRSVVLGIAALVTGMLALLLLAALAFFAIFRGQLGISYEAWRLSHVLSSFAVAGLGLHHTLDTGRYAQDPASAAFWIAATALATAALAKVYLLDPLLAVRRRYRVSAVQPEAERTWRMRLEPATARRLRFRAGQFIWLKLGRAFGSITEHPFSIASSPEAPGRLDLLIKEAGDFTGAIGKVAAGTHAYMHGPYGNFTLEGREGAGIALIAGGIGIAPVLSILHQLAARGDRRPVRLLYGNRSATQIVARPELDALAGALDLQVHHVLSEPPAGWTGARGVLDAVTLAACLPGEGRGDWLYFVCGPPEMIDSVELSLHDLRVPLSQIVSERFTYQGGGRTPRERLLRAVLGGALGLIVLGALLFASPR